jgi:uncharacterized SAM-binding protein YcdF (DUF218 family)
MWSRVYIFGISFSIIVLCVGSCRHAGQWLVKEDHPEHSDAMVILMGSIADRVLQAADLYDQKMAEKIIMVESSMGADKDLEEKGVHIISNTKQVYNALVTLGIPADSILILPGNASSTQMEAIIIRDYLKSNPEIDTVLLVSSSDHLRRATMIFKSALKNSCMPVNIISCPSNYTDFDAERWWRSRDGIEVVLLEYLKIGSFIVFERRKLK